MAETFKILMFSEILRVVLDIDWFWVLDIAKYLSRFQIFPLSYYFVSERKFIIILHYLSVSYLLFQFVINFLFVLHIVLQSLQLFASVFRYLPLDTYYVIFE
jgi:hypothetical protein